MSFFRRAVHLARDTGLAVAGVIIVAVAILFPRVFGGRSPAGDIGLSGPDVTSADLPGCDSAELQDDGVGCSSCSSSTGSGSCGTGGGGG